MKEAGIVRIRTSILRKQNTVAQFIATRPIMGLCEAEVRRPGARVARRWWEQTGIDWKAAREKATENEEDEAAEAAETELTGSESEPEADTPGGTVDGTGEGSTWEQAAPVERSGVGRRINSSGGDLKHDQVVFLKKYYGTESRVQYSRCSGIGTPPPNN